MERAPKRAAASGAAATPKTRGPPEGTAKTATGGAPRKPHAEGTGWGRDPKGAGGAGTPAPHDRADQRGLALGSAPRTARRPAEAQPGWARRERGELRKPPRKGGGAQPQPLGNTRTKKLGWAPPPQKM